MVLLMRRAVFGLFLFGIWERVFAEREEEVLEERLDIDGLDGMDKFDGDGDGKVSLDEMMTVLLDFPEDEHPLMKEENGKVTAFFNEMGPIFFADVDDGDGFLSAGELPTFIDRLEEAYAISKEAAENEDM
eukprot:TRINITY_DN7374_c0_g5_i1.p2 TRINITY_DN7374_c0_g5~~TRINITY_DN7374_c0_g5_i1.p2  ORF type:complete len:131 (-),score=33.11 TRINITY_DN7374_c0_g5_i1:10-402(-)